MDLVFDAAREALRLLVEGSPYLLEIVLLSLRVSGSAVFLGVLIGLPVGIAVGLTRFPGRQFVVAAIHTGFALPPVVVGLFIYMLLSRQGPLGDLELLFTPTAMVIAQATLAGFGAVISEVGAVMMVGGNILGETRVMTTAIVLETRRGNFAVALALGLVLLALAFAINLALTRIQQGRRGAPWAPPMADRPWA